MRPGVLHSNPMIIPDWSWLVVTGLAIVSGFVVLGRLQSTRTGMTAPQTMLLLGVLGMLAGLLLDARGPGLDALMSLCSTSGSVGFVTAMTLHWTWLPLMHVGMAMGGLSVIPLMRFSRSRCGRPLCGRIVQNIGCCAWMIAGMTCGALLYQRIAGAASIFGEGPAGMLGSMFAGMVWGMVVGVVLIRFYFNVRTKISVRIVNG